MFGVSGHSFEGEETQGDRLLPLGLLRTGGRVFWVMQATGYESSAVVIDEMTSSGIRQVLTVDGGGC